MTDSHDILTPIQKREQFGRKYSRRGPVGLFNFDFVGRWVVGGRGGTQPPNIYNVKCDIRVLTRYSNWLVSQYDLLTYAYKDITRVISKGRDRLVEIGSNSLLSHECK